MKGIDLSFINYRPMYNIKIKQAPDGKYYWVMYSSRGQVICRSDRFNRKLGALYTANMVKYRNMKVDVVEEQSPKAVIKAGRKCYGY